MSKKVTKKIKLKLLFSLIKNPLFIDGVLVTDKGVEFKNKESNKLKTAIKNGLVEWR